MTTRGHAHQIYTLYMYACVCIHTQSYACSWRRLSPSTDGMSGESKDLWLFFFTEHLPDISEKLAEGLQGIVFDDAILCTCNWWSTVEQKRREGVGMMEWQQNLVPCFIGHSITLLKGEWEHLDIHYYQVLYTTSLIDAHLLCISRYNAYLINRSNYSVLL